jgi:predicted glycoside hydrolase/deacetylase ChbG (UPF0249 family)
VDPRDQGQLIITADDWGYSPRYNAGIEEAAGARAIDAVSVMVLREHSDPGPLREHRVEIGLHIEHPEGVGYREIMDAPRRQAEAFEKLFGEAPAYIDGHRHCHASLPIATAVEDLALELRVPVRAVGEDHRFRLRDRRISTPDRLIGRVYEREPAMPQLIGKALEEQAMPPGTTEWVVHPGHGDPPAGSRYDRGREEDLSLLLRLVDEELLAGARANHREALGATQLAAR